VSIVQAVLWINARSISHWVWSSTRGNWIAWLAASGLPNGYEERGDTVAFAWSAAGSGAHQHQQTDVVAHDRVLILQVAVQPQALARQMLPDDRHSQVGAVHTAVLHREGVTVKACVVGAAPCFGEQRLPFLAGQAAAVPAGPGVLAPVIENRMLSFSRSSGRISRSMNSSVFASRPTRSSGSVKSMGTALLAADLISSAGLSRTRPIRWQPPLSPA
jgi:hypothetical protein